MKAQGEIDVELYSFFNLDTRWGGWSMPYPGHFTPGKRPVIHFIGGWVGLRAGWDICGKSCCYWNMIHRLCSL